MYDSYLQTPGWSITCARRIAVRANHVSRELAARARARGGVVVVHRMIANRHDHGAKRNAARGPLPLFPTRAPSITRGGQEAAHAAPADDGDAGGMARGMRHASGQECAQAQAS